MKTVVISGSSKLQDKIDYWVNHFKSNQYKILDYPEVIDPDDYEKKLPAVYKEFYSNLEITNTFFLMNEEKNGVKGYVGASAIAELTYVVIQNLIHNKKIDIYILNEPSKEVPAYDEIMFWLKLGWINLYEGGK